MAIVHPELIPENSCKLLRFPVTNSCVGRILAYLLAAESKAEAVAEKETYILARSVVAVASLPEYSNRRKLNPDAFFWAFVNVYGSAPEVIARKAARVRAFMLGRSPVAVRKSAGVILAREVAA